MGIAAHCPKEQCGISFPSSNTSKCHAVFFPTSADEQCFQFHFHIPAEYTDQGSWGNLSREMTREQCQALASQLRADGWHERYLEPLEQVTKAVKIGFCVLQPRLAKWVYHQNRVILVGDAAHPPLPYTNQGGQQGLEDAGSIALLLKHFCLDNQGRFRTRNLSQATKAYEELRIPRTTEVLDVAQAMGELQQKRAESAKVEIIQEELIQRQVFFHETLPAMFTGVRYDYQEQVKKAVQKKPEVLTVLLEEEEC